MKPKFDMGDVYLTANVAALVNDENQSDLQEILQRHHSGDWGQVGEEDSESNNQALILGNRLVSTYALPTSSGETQVLVITEADRSVTTVLLPEDY